MKMRQMRYSEAFKLHVCNELKDGKWTSTREAARAYNIRPTTVTAWMDALGFGHLRQRITHVSTPKEIDETAELKAEIKRLKAQLFDAMIDQRIERAALKVACEQYGVDPETYRKAALQG